MASATTQSTITNGQIGQINDRLATKLRESGLPMKEVQGILTVPGGEVIDEMVFALRRRVEAISQMIIVEVEVDRDQTPQEAVDATGRKQYVNGEVLKTMPRTGPKKVKVGFFKPGRWLSDDELAEEMKLHGLQDDPLAVAAANKKYPAFADEKPNGCHWQDANGKWCYMAFSRWGGERYVGVARFGGLGWGDFWWFGGVLASS